MVYPIAIGAHASAAVRGARDADRRPLVPAEAMPDELNTVMRTIASELRHQYLLGYTPSRPIVRGRRAVAHHHRPRQPRRRHRPRARRLPREVAAHGQVRRIAAASVRNAPSRRHDAHASARLRAFRAAAASGRRTAGGRRQIDHARRGSPALCASASTSSRVKRGRKKPALKRRRAAQLVVQFVADRFARRRAPGRPSAAAAAASIARAQREEDPLARDRIDQAGGVAEQHPSVAGRLFAHRRRARRATESATRSAAARVRPPARSRPASDR